ncbi:S-layer homology domain-containing protein [Thermicanus aegyptius]|uniref:S-layer homology domain-containing protein n=1 Tax=Thermicanus aegyptius TaxID=94009 RepID=UPI0004910179|nr:S-layer homology domain-containing protein [Thermicanus aegyptius]
MKRWRKQIRILLVLMVMASGIPMSVSAEGGPFRDVKSGDWFQKDVLMMNALGVIQGYPDGSYQPSRGVTKAEALVMLLRYMGLTEEVERLPDADLYLYLPGLGLEKSGVADWAAKALAFGKKMGWLNVDQGAFDWQGSADRAWISELLIRAIQKLGDAADMATNATGFTDDRTISNAARGFVNAAVKNGLMKGYPADNTFRPNGTVTRAEMATLLPRLDPYITPMTQKVEGVVLKVSGDRFTLIDRTGKQADYLIDEKTLFLAGGESKPLSSLKSRDQVSVAVKGDKALFLELVAENVSLYQEAKGTVTKVLPEQHLLVLANEGGGFQTLPYDDQTEVWQGNGWQKGVDLSVFLNVKVVITYTPAPQGKILQIKPEDSASGNLFQGEVVNVDADKKLLILKDPLGNFMTFIYSDATVVKMEGRRFPTVEDLRPGDRVEVDRNVSPLQEIRVLSYVDSTEVTGEVVAILYEKGLITLQVGGEVMGYFLAEDVQILLSGETNPTLDDVKEGDQVKLTIEKGYVKKLEITGRTSPAAVSGKLVSMDRTQGILTVEDEKGELKAYRIDPNYTVLLDGEKVSESRLTVGTPVQLEFRRNLVSVISLDLIREGTFLSYDSTNREMLVREGSGERRYSLSGSFTLYSFSNSSLTVSQLAKDTELKLLLNSDGSISSIRVKETGIYTLVDRTLSTNRLKLKDENGNIDYTNYTGQTLLLNPDGTAGKWEDLKVGDRLSLSFIGKDLIRVEREERLYGQVKSVNATAGTLVVDQAGTERTFKPASLSSLITGDYVQVVQVGSQATVTKATVNRALVDYVDEPDLKIYVKEGTTYKWISFDKDAVVKRKGYWVTFSSLMKNDEIFYYTIDGKVIAIEVK